ncbi:hypothetical protein MRB53_039062 [Persea americana]|nr:hypothetical protein MRB53_039062 [Persea americana]
MHDERVYDKIELWRKRLTELDLDFERADPLAPVRVISGKERLGRSRPSAFALTLNGALVLSVCPCYPTAGDMLLGHNTSDSLGFNVVSEHTSASMTTLRLDLCFGVELYLGTVIARTPAVTKREAMLKRAIQASKSARVIRTYQRALQKQPLLTQVCTGSVLVVIGDGLAQRLVERTQKHDYERSARMVLLRGVVHSTFIIYWYRAPQSLCGTSRHDAK